MDFKQTLTTLCLLALLSYSFAQPLPWKKYSNSQGAFSVEFPGEPKITETSNKSPEGYEVKVKMFTVQEQGNVSYVLYNEMQAGVNIMDDSTYLASVTNQILERFGREPKILEDTRFEKFPGKHFIVEFPDGVAEGKIFLRTNRAYFVVSFFPGAREADRKKFLNSFQFLPYQKMMSVGYQSPEHFFKINFPSKPVLSTEQNDDGSPLYAYYAMDPNSGNNYSVAVTQFSPYAQYESDSAILADRVNGYRAGGDTMIIAKDVIVDGRPAKDLIINQGKNNFKLRVRIFTNGVNSYTIFTFLPFDEIRAPHVNQVFDSFKFTGKVPGNLLSDKRELMLKDIESSDTAKLNAVIPAITSSIFEEVHFPKIKELLLKDFNDEADTLFYRKATLLKTLKHIESPTMVSFIKELFPTFKGNAELEYNALLVLAELNSKEANDLILELLPLHHPVKDGLWKYMNILSHERIDSAGSREFFFKVIPLINNSAYKTPLYWSAQALLREKRIAFEDLAAYRPVIYQDFKSQYNLFVNDTVYHTLDNLISIIAFDKPGKPEIDLLRKLSASENYYLAIRAQSALLRLQQKPDEKTNEMIAKDKYFRIDLLSEFQDFGLEKFFPKKYYRQDSIAVSELYNYAADEYGTPSAMKVLHSETLTYRGELKKFFVIELHYNDDDLKVRGVAGPYAPDRVETFGELTGSFFEENRELTHHDYLLDYISQFEQ